MVTRNSLTPCAFLAPQAPKPDTVFALHPCRFIRNQDMTPLARLRSSSDPVVGWGLILMQQWIICGRRSMACRVPARRHFPDLFGISIPRVAWGPFRRVAHNVFHQPYTAAFLNPIDALQYE